MDIEAQRNEVIDHILDVLLAGFGLHHDNHELSSDFFRREKRPPQAGLFALDNRSALRAGAGTT
jgi:hypothetical protein